GDKNCAATAAGCSAAVVVDSATTSATGSANQGNYGYGAEAQPSLPSVRASTTRGSIRSKTSTAATAGQADRRAADASPTGAWSISRNSSERLVEAVTAGAATEPAWSTSATKAIRVSRLTVHVDRAGDCNVAARQYRQRLVG